jgi:hypothetical protein
MLHLKIVSSKQEAASRPPSLCSLPSAPCPLLSALCSLPSAPYPPAPRTPQACA